MVSIGVTVSPTRNARKMTAQLERAEMEPDEEDGLAGHDRLGDELGRVEVEALVDVAGVSAGVRATSR